jgi:hypothetical protein
MSTSKLYDGWDWVVRCYYADDVKPPKRPGELAIETVHRGDHSKDTAVAVLSAEWATSPSSVSGGSVSATSPASF